MGEVVRLYLVNTANTRIFNFALRGARMKLVGGDSGRYERETFVDEVMLAPSERAVLDVLFDTPGEVRLEHRTPDHVYDLGAFAVEGSSTGGRRGVVRRVARRPRAHRRASVDRSRHRTAAGQGARLRGLDAAPLRGRRCAGDLLRLPDAPGGHVVGAGNLPEVRHEVAPGALRGGPTPASYACPMHPEVTSSEPGTCPKCGMKLVPADTLPATEPKPSEGAIHHEHEGHEQNDGLEWEDLMPEINRASEPSNMRWMLIDRESGAENGAITLGVHGRRPGEDPTRQRDGIRSPDAPPVPRPRRGPLPRPVSRGRAGVQPGVEGHRARARGTDRGHPARRLESRTVDGALPHRRARPERDDVQLQRVAT